MADETIETQGGTPTNEMDSFIESITDTAQKKAFRETLNDDGSFNKEKIRDLAGRYLSERRNISRINEMPESAGKKRRWRPESVWDCTITS